MVDKCFRVPSLVPSSRFQETGWLNLVAGSMHYSVWPRCLLKILSSTKPPHQLFCSDFGIVRQCAASDGTLCLCSEMCLLGISALVSSPNAHRSPRACSTGRFLSCSPMYTLSYIAIVIAWGSQAYLVFSSLCRLTSSFLYTLPMLPQVSSQLLFLLTTVSILLSTAFAQTPNWLFPPVVQNAGSYVFESQDTIAASWTSDFVAPVLSMFCQISGPWSVSKCDIHAHLS